MDQPAGLVESKGKRKHPTKRATKAMKHPKIPGVQGYSLDNDVEDLQHMNARRDNWIVPDDSHFCTTMIQWEDTPTGYTCDEMSKLEVKLQCIEDKMEPCFIKLDKWNQQLNVLTRIIEIMEGS